MKIRTALRAVTVVVITAWCLGPFVWMVRTSFTTEPEVLTGNSLIPSAPSTANYEAAFSAQNSFLRALTNSLAVAGITTVLALIIGLTCAYALARLTFRGRNLVLAATLATSMFPMVSILAPLFTIFTGLGWIDTYQALVLPNISLALPLAVWTLTGFFRQLPWDLEEAALVDGCTRRQATRKVLLPLLAPAVFTTAILVFITAWNEFIIALTMTNRQEMFTAPVAIANFTGEITHQSPFPSQMAASVVVTLPLIVLVLIFQRRIVAGLTAGATKG
ncbi:carbohydrate ABC transporter permease [Sinosporangium siamense]|uniref:ABC transporter permease n=1 Tax=Sinosporangium siamense TaxID=1367973 RepID=A0A919RLN5_9ACTN|nr:carbohydrate ABC transporter permease [Sinosporangium siamense]GII96096.1 ABC transporter permease [Sinosporangium siamense]